MAVLTIIAGVPLYTTVQEALTWAAGNNCTGYHTHNHQGQQGFMGCTNHLQASGMPLNSNAPRPTLPPAQSNAPTVRPPVTTTPRVSSSSSSSFSGSSGSSSGGGGGGGGY